MLFNNEKQSKKSKGAWESSGIWKRIANPQKILEAERLLEAGLIKAGLVWCRVLLFVVQKFEWVERLLTIPCLLTNVLD